MLERLDIDPEQFIATAARVLDLFRGSTGVSVQMHSAQTGEPARPAPKSAWSPVFGAKNLRLSASHPVIFGRNIAGSMG